MIQCDLGESRFRERAADRFGRQIIFRLEQQSDGLSVVFKMLPERFQTAFGLAFVVVAFADGRFQAAEAGGVLFRRKFGKDLAVFLVSFVVGEFISVSELLNV